MARPLSWPKGVPMVQPTELEKADAGWSRVRVEQGKGLRNWFETFLGYTACMDPSHAHAHAHKLVSTACAVIRWRSWLKHAVCKHACPYMQAGVLLAYMKSMRIYVHVILLSPFVHPIPHHHRQST